jgi:hypothetical protein
MARWSAQFELLIAAAESGAPESIEDGTEAIRARAAGTAAALSNWASVH